MPQNKFALARYRLIDELLRKEDYVKTSFIVLLCKKRFGFEVTQRTIQMDMEALKSDPFLGCLFPICYCTKNKGYYYSEEPKGKFLAFCLLDTELNLFYKLKDVLKDILDIDDYQLYCDILNKIQNYLNIKAC